MRFSGLKVVLAAGVLAAGVYLHGHFSAEGGAPRSGESVLAATPLPADEAAPAKKALLVKPLVSPAEPPPPSAPEEDGDEDALRRCEQEMNRLPSVRAQFTQTVKDRTLQRTEVYDGTLQYLKPNRASFELRRKGETEVVAKLVISGALLYEYAPHQKSVRVHNLPLPKPSLLATVGDTVLSLLWGMSAKDARRRYDIKHVKTDQWYVYLEIRPRLPADRASFGKARLVLSRSTFLPRQFWVQESNGTERTWDIPRIEENVALDRADFDSPRLPAGWRLQRLPASEGPRSRPSDKP
jgi:TIGR03009 family protein